MNNLIKKGFLLFNTVRYLRFIQIYYQIKKRIKINKKKYNKLTDIQIKMPNTPLLFIRKDLFWDGENEFEFIGLRHSPSDWNDESMDKLWIYNLHYFDFILNSKNSTISKTEIIKKWIKDNPLGFKNGWEPYPISLRITNLIKFSLEQESHNFTELHQSLYLQYIYLKDNIEYHLLGNHLFSNLKALLFASLYFKDEIYLKFVIKKIIIELDEQFQKDGSHFELSPMYHSIVLEDLLDIISLAKSYSYSLPNKFNITAEQALNYLRNITFIDGSLPHFNDSTEGICQNLKTLEQYSVELNIKSGDKLAHHYSQNSGIIRNDTKSSSIIFDGGQIGASYLPGHAHADNLTYEFFKDSRKLIVDTGISSYQDIDKRKIERSSTAHNVLTPNNNNSSEIWSSFRVARRAISKKVHLSFKPHSMKLVFQCATYINDIITRSITHTDIFLEVSDEVEMKTDLYSHIHFNSNVEVDIVGTQHIKIKAQSEMNLFHNATHHKVIKYKLCLGFNQQIDAYKIILNSKNSKNITYKIEYN